MARPIRFTRKSYFVDPATIRRAKRALGARTDAEAIRQSVEHVADMDVFWRFMDKARGSIRPGSFDHAE